MRLCAILRRTKNNVGAIIGSKVNDTPFQVRTFCNRNQGWLSHQVTLSMSPIICYTWTNRIPKRSNFFTTGVSDRNSLWRAPFIYHIISKFLYVVFRFRTNKFITSCIVNNILFKQCTVRRFIYFNVYPKLCLKCKFYNIF